MWVRGLPGRQPRVVEDLDHFSLRDPHSSFYFLFCRFTFSLFVAVLASTIRFSYCTVGYVKNSVCKRFRIPTLARVS